MPMNASAIPTPAQHMPMPPPAPAQPAVIPLPVPAQQPATMPPQTINFNAYVDKARRVYDKYSSSSSSEEYENSFDATSELQAIVKTIRAQAYKVSFAGKQDAINAIAEIALEMLDEGGSTLSSEIRKGFYWDSAGDAIERIIDSHSPKEISILQQDGDLVKELDGLKESAAEYALDVGLDGAIEKLTGSVSDGEEEEDKEDDGGRGHIAAGPSQPPAVLQGAAAFGQTVAAPLVVG